MGVIIYLLAGALVLAITLKYGKCQDNLKGQSDWAIGVALFIWFIIWLPLCLAAAFWTLINDLGKVLKKLV